MNNDKSTNTEPEKSNNKSLIINAFLVGLFIGVVIYGVAKNNIGFFGLIPVLFAFKLLNKPKSNKSSDD